MIVATNNQGKLKELKEILNSYELYSLKESNIDIDVEENQDTFYGNAIKKAKEIYEISNIPVIADDSGLCITALDNWPGVLTHRFLGEQATDLERNSYILEKMKNIKNREAKFICNLIYYDGKNIVVGEGALTGTISFERRGSNGFGFDEIFELENGKTLAELLPNEKNTISARYLATIDLKEKLNGIHIF